MQYFGEGYKIAKNQHKPANIFSDNIIFGVDVINFSMLQQQATLQA